MISDASASRYWHTIRLLNKRQLLHRIRLRSQRQLYTAGPGARYDRWASQRSTNGAWPEGFAPIDYGIDHLPMSEGERGPAVYALLGEEVDVGLDGWRSPERTQLFRYHLHYFDWAWPLANAATSGDAAAKMSFQNLWKTWQADTQPGRWDEWSPYVVSLRAWTLCGVFESLVRGTEIESEVLAHQRAALGFFDRNLELDVGGNHLIKNLKAVIGLCIFFDDRTRLDRTLRRFGKQLDHQVLDDGGHFELSPSYHAQVLADVVDIVGICEAAHVALPFDGKSVISAMSRWLRTMTYPNNTLPMLGDCTPPLPGLLASLPTGEESTEPDRLTVLPETGYVCVRHDDTMLIVDFGAPCPPELPAHAQADWGTFELWHNGSRLICDPGVSTYVGARRADERSTALHNTVSVNGRNQTDVWSSFRAGKRARPSPIDITENGAAVSFGSLLIDIHGIRHRRSFHVTASEVHITDSIEPKVDGALSVLTLPADVDVADIKADHATTLRPTQIAVGFGHLVGAQRLEQSLVGGKASWTIPLASTSGGG